MRTVFLRGDPDAGRFGPVRIAESGWQRMRGLLGRAPLRDGEGLLIVDCGSVHTVGMRHAIEVVFIDRQGRIARIVQALRPMRMARCGRADRVLELAAGQARALGLRTGLRLVASAPHPAEKDA